MGTETTAAMTAAVESTTATNATRRTGPTSSFSGLDHMACLPVLPLRVTEEMRSGRFIAKAKPGWLAAGLLCPSPAHQGWGKKGLVRRGQATKCDRSLIRSQGVTSSPVGPPPNLRLPIYFGLSGCKSSGH